MRSITIAVLGIALGIVAGAAGFLVHRALSPAPDPSAAAPAPSAAAAPREAVAAAVTSLPAPAFTLPDTEGRPREVGEWRGKVLVINFWATWCPPCLEEIPIFNALQDELGERGLQFLGIAIDELENVRAFAAEHAMRYPTLHGQLDAIDVGKRYGNQLGALPYTVVVDRDGTIAHTHAGPLDRATTEKLVGALL